jgi:hypothetical protein
LAGEPGLDIGQPNIIRPSVAADRGPVAALVIGAIDQETANVTGSHFSKSDLPSGGHAPLKRGRDRQATNLAVRGLKHGPALGLLGAEEAGAVPGPQTSTWEGRGPLE